jgi:hypothetical protein
MSSLAERLAGSMTPRRVVVAVAVIGAAMLALGVLVSPRTEAGDRSGPGGTLGLRRLLREMAIPVLDRATPPDPPATFVVLVDLRTSQQDGALLRWASEGGRLVVADPDSEIMSEVGVRVSPLGGSLFGDRTLHPGCVAPEAAGVRTIEVDPGDAALTPGRATTVSCFRASSGAYAASLRHGRGTVVTLGGASFLVNERLGRADNALFSVRLLDAGGPVDFGPALPPGGAAAGRTSIWAALPAGARAGIVALVLALVAFAVARGRRLGRPVPEDPVSPIPAGELVHASGNLYRMARATPFAASLLRRGAVARMARRVGLEPGGSPATLASRVSELTGEDPQALEWILAGADPRTDEELIMLARRLEDATRRVEGEGDGLESSRSLATAARGPAL